MRNYKIKPCTCIDNPICQLFYHECNIHLNMYIFENVYTVHILKQIACLYKEIPVIELQNDLSVFAKHTWKGLVKNVFKRTIQTAL